MSIVDVITSVFSVVVLPALAWLDHRIKAEVRKHLTPNGGSSLADRIARLESAVEEIRGWVRNGYQAPPVSGPGQTEESRPA